MSSRASQAEYLRGKPVHVSYSQPDLDFWGSVSRACSRADPTGKDQVIAAASHLALSMKDTVM